MRKDKARLVVSQLSAIATSDLKSKPRPTGFKKHSDPSHPQPQENEIRSPCQGGDLARLFCAKYYLDTVANFIKKIG